MDKFEPIPIAPPCFLSVPYHVASVNCPNPCADEIALRPAPVLYTLFFELSELIGAAFVLNDLPDSKYAILASNPASTPNLPAAFFILSRTLPKFSRAFAVGAVVERGTSPPPSSPPIQAGNILFILLITAVNGLDANATMAATLAFIVSRILGPKSPNVFNIDVIPPPMLVNIFGIKSFMLVSILSVPSSNLSFVLVVISLRLLVNELNEPRCCCDTLTAFLFTASTPLRVDLIVFSLSLFALRLMSRAINPA